MYTAVLQRNTYQGLRKIKTKIREASTPLNRHQRKSSPNGQALIQALPCTSCISINYSATLSMSSTAP